VTRGFWTGAGFAVAVGLALRLWIAPSLGYEGLDSDLIEHKQAMHLVLTRGLHEIYVPSAANDPALSGHDWDGSYFANQPPLIYYLRYLPIRAYRAISPRGFEMWGEDLNYLVLEKTDLVPRLAATRGFTAALKVPGIVADAAITLALAVFLCGRIGSGPAVAAAWGYALNPGIVFDTAFWGQHDAVAALLVAACVWLFAGDRLEWGSAALALALLTKPQVAGFALVITGMAVMRFPPRRVASAALVALLTVAVVFLPFVVHGTLGLSLTALWKSTLGGEPFVSCNANNFWWLLSGGNGYGVLDTRPALGPLTLRALGIGAVLATQLVILLSLGRRSVVPDVARDFLAVALAGFAFFMFGTELHENHMMAVLPLMAFALPWGRRRLAVVLAVLSLTFLLNLALFDPAVVDPLTRYVGHPLPLTALSVANAALNLAAFLATWAIYVSDRPLGYR
jgi:hypothetical protein